MAKWGEIKCREAASKCPTCEELEAEAKIQGVILKSVIKERDATFALMLKRAETAEAKLSKCEALLAMALEALKFYAEADNYEDQHKPESCGCCYYLHDAEIKEDEGAKARTTLAAITGDTP